MTVHFFTKGDVRTASSRQRAFLIAEELTENGHIEAVVCYPPINTISETPWPKKGGLILTACKNLWRVKRGDIVFLQRAIQNKYFFTALIFQKLFSRRKMILDLDDAIYLHSPHKTKIVSRIADAVIVGSHSLADWAKTYNKNVHLIPTGVRVSDYEKFDSSRRERNNQFTIGWIGNGPAHYENLRLLVPVLEEVARREPGIRFRLVGSLGDKRVCALFQNIGGLHAEFIDSLDWGDREAIPRAIQEFDIGLMPLVDSEWNRGKCAFKAIEYMACSVPAILSPVGENNYLVKDSVNGFLPSSLQEWADDILKLYADDGLRVDIGRLANKTVNEWYSLRKSAFLLQTILTQL